MKYSDEQIEQECEAMRDVMGKTRSFTSMHQAAKSSLEIIEQLRAELAEANVKRSFLEAEIKKLGVWIEEKDLKCINLRADIERKRARIAELESSLKRIGDQSEECGDPANPAFFELVSLISDEVAKHKETPHA